MGHTLLRKENIAHLVDGHVSRKLIPMIQNSISFECMIREGPTKAFHRRAKMGILNLWIAMAKWKSSAPSFAYTPWIKPNNIVIRAELDVQSASCKVRTIHQTHEFLQ